MKTEEYYDARSFSMYWKRAQVGLEKINKDLKQSRCEIH